MIWFKIREMYKHLFNHGEIYVLRTSPAREEIQQFRNAFNLGSIRKVMVEKVEDIDLNDIISKAELKKYLRKSGFKTIEEWIASLETSKSKFSLYHIILVGWNPEKDRVS